MLEQINNDITVEMKAGNKFNLSVLRMLKAALQNEEINKKEPLTDEEVLSVIKKQVKIRKESKTEYEKYERQDLVNNLTKEIEILTKYLPEEISEDELIKIIDEVIKETNATDIKAMGTVINSIKTKVGASADMSLVSKLVKEKLSNL